MGIAIVGIDLGKNACTLAGLDSSGRVVFAASDAPESAGGLRYGPRALRLAIEACRGARHLGRMFAAQGREAPLMSPEYVKFVEC